jgi:hypothetical protein
MYMKVFPHGQGGGEQPTNYLVRMDYPGRKDSPPENLRGDPATTRALIDSIDRKWKFTAGVLSWHPDDHPTPAQQERVMDDFERVAFAGLEPDQRYILWVRHSHAGHSELHFVIPRLDLASGKDFNACPPGWQKDFDVFRDLHNWREGWARPDDPARMRERTPEHADLHRARLLRWGKEPSPDARAEAKDAIHAYLMAQIERGLVQNRADMLTALREAGLEINRAGKDYITVKDPEGGEKLRLKGGIYGEQWTFDLAGRAPEGQDRAGRLGNRDRDPERVRELEQELERVLEKRADCNRKRYPQRYGELGKEALDRLPHFERGLQQEMPASRGLALHPAPDVGNRGLRHGGLAAERSIGLTDGDRGPQGRGIGLGGQEKSDREHIQGAGREPGRDGHVLPVAPGELHLPRQQPLRRETRGVVLTEEIDHDRTGTHLEGHLDPHGTGEQRRPASPQAGDRGPAREDNPPRYGATAIRAAFTRLVRCIQELGTLVDALERRRELKMKEREEERERERQREAERARPMFRMR